MTYRAHVKNGQIVLDEPAQLKEGATLTVIERPELATATRSLAEFITRLPAGKRTKAEIDQQILEERDSWEAR